MTVPERSINEDREPSTREREIWGAGQIFPVTTPPAHSVSEQRSSKKQFRLRVFHTDGPHIAALRLGGHRRHALKRSSEDPSDPAAFLAGSGAWRT
jgi:hypothetical protein